MKKIILIVSVLVVSGLVFGAAGLAYAQSQLPEDTNLAEVLPRMFGARGRGMMDGQARMSAMRSGQSLPEAALQRPGTPGDGLLHDYIVEAMAEALGLTPEELNTRLESGETMWQVAGAQGISQEDFRALMAEAMQAALAQAVEDGAITQEQADLMAQRMGRMGSRPLGPGMRGGGGPFQNQDSPLHPYMQESLLEVFAGPLNTTPADLKARLDAGDTLRQIAVEAGLSQEQFIELKAAARQAAIEAATEAGLISEERAGSMQERMGSRQPGSGPRGGGGPGGFGARQGAGCQGNR